MRTIKECIVASTYKTEAGILPLSLGYFLRAMADILMFDAYQRLQQEVPSLIAGEVKQNGKPVKEPNVYFIHSVLTGEDFLRGMSQDLQVYNFLGWFLEQKEPEDGCPWSDFSFIANKWNEFAEKEANNG